MTNHSMMGHGSMDHSMMDHSKMDHNNMDHGSMDHSQMDHSSMDHGRMNDESMGHGHMMDMKMYFHASVMSTILFEPWMTHNASQMVGSCIALFFVALLYEGLKVLREELLYKAHMKMQEGPETVPQHDESMEGHGNGTGSDQGIIRSKPSVGKKMCNRWHVIQTFLHILQVTISYMLMLVFMTYNVWLCLAVVLGAGTGYFFFGWRKQTVMDVNEHCH